MANGEIHIKATPEEKARIQNFLKATRGGSMSSFLLRHGLRVVDQWEQEQEERAYRRQALEAVS